MLYEYTIRFGMKRGCSLGVLNEMARYDSATVRRTINDLNCSRDCVRAATLHGALPPTMGRWESFPVGAAIVGEVRKLRDTP